MMKRKTYIRFCIFAVFLLMLTGCGRQNPDKDDAYASPVPMTIRILNKADTTIKDVGISYSVEGKTLGSIVMVDADGKALKFGEAHEFTLLEADFPALEVIDLEIDVFTTPEHSSDYILCGTISIDQAYFGWAYEVSLSGNPEDGFCLSAVTASDNFYRDENRTK